MNGFWNLFLIVELTVGNFVTVAENRLHLHALTNRTVIF